jgi:hypothetical protein
MPIFQDDQDMDRGLKGASGFHYSAVKLSKLGASEYTIVGIAADVSGSTTAFRPGIESMVKTVIESCRLSPRADNLMARLMVFSNHIEEVHGFRLLNDCHLAAYDGVITNARSGMTSLYDTSVDLVSSMAKYGKTLLQNDYTVNGVMFVITDGRDEGSTLTVSALREAIAEAMKTESLESLTTVLIGVSVDTATDAYLQQLKTDAGFSQYVGLADATTKSLAKLGGFISRSISSASQSVGTGGPSAPLTF